MPSKKGGISIQFCLFCFKLLLRAQISESMTLNTFVRRKKVLEKIENFCWSFLHLKFFQLLLLFFLEWVKKAPSTRSKISIQFCVFDFKSSLRTQISESMTLNTFVRRKKILHQFENFLKNLLFHSRYVFSWTKIVKDNILQIGILSSEEPILHILWHLKMRIRTGILYFWVLQKKNSFLTSARKTALEKKNTPQIKSINFFKI